MAGKGSFFWYELMTTDVEAAVRFYGDVVGWTAEKMGGEHGYYTVLNGGGRGVAGAMSLADMPGGSEAPPAWLGYLRVADVDAAAAGVAEAGGTVCKQPEDIPGIGRFAVLSDPGGAVFAMLQPSTEGEPWAVVDEVPGHVGWHELYAGQGEKAAFDFYSGQFGWTTATLMPMGEMGDYRIFEDEGLAVGGMMDRPKEMPVSAWQFYFNVDGIDAAVERVKAGGGQIFQGPMEVPGGSWIINGRDPQGAHFALVSQTR